MKWRERLWGIESDDVVRVFEKKFSIQEEALVFKLRGQLLSVSSHFSYSRVGRRAGRIRVVAAGC